MRVTRLAAAFALLVTVLLNVSRAHADDVYFFKSIDDLKVTKGQLPPKGEGHPDYTYWNDSTWSARDRQSARRTICRVVLDGPGEAFAAFEESPETRPRTVRKIAIRAPSGKKVTGRLWLPDRDQKPENSAIHFEVDASKTQKR